MLAMSPFTALLPRVVQSHYHRGVGSYGLLFSAMAAGMVAGSLIWARWHPRKWRVAICFGAFGINDLGIIVVALSPWYPLAVVAVAWRGLWIGVGIAAWLTLITELVPEHLLSRVISLDFFGSLGLTPVGFVLAGVAATTVAPTTILAVGGALGAPSGSSPWRGPGPNRRVAVWSSSHPEPPLSPPTSSEEEEGRRGKHGFPRPVSGCGDLNSRPLRPERSALPGCATPRDARQVSG